MLLLAANPWYTTFAPHKLPTDHNTMLWGLLHGFLAVLNLFYSLIDRQATIYQSPNSGIEYNTAFVFGFLVFVLVILRGRRRWI